MSSTDYYNVIPGDKLMDGTDERCEYCDGIVNDDGEYYIPEDDLCTGDCNDG